MLKKTATLFLAISLVLALLLPTACAGPPVSTADPVKLVPANANILAYANVGAILADELLPRAYALLPKDESDPQTWEAMLAMFAQQIGLELERFRELWFFGDTADMAKRSGYFAVIVKGNYTEPQLLDPIGQAIGTHLTPIDYRGRTIYTFGEQTWGVSMLSPDTFVAGGMAPIMDVISIMDGRAAAVSGKVLDLYNGLGGGLFKLSAYLPEGLRASVKEQLDKTVPYLPINLPAIAEMDTAGIVVALNGEQVLFDSKFCFTNEKSAQDIELLVKSASALMNWMGLTDKMQEFGKIVEKIKVERSGSCVDVSLDVPRSEIEKLLSG